MSIKDDIAKELCKSIGYDGYMCSDSPVLYDKVSGNYHEGATIHKIADYILSREKELLKEIREKRDSFDGNDYAERMDELLDNLIKQREK